MVSVIVPVYNVKPYLEEAVESIIHQTYTDMEIILIDDGSTDGSGELCDYFENKDKRIRVIHQENRGLSAARNAGLDICLGEYIAFLDSDDAFCKDFLKIMLESLQRNNADIAECNYAYYYCNHHMDEKYINFKHKRYSKKREGTYSTREALNMSLNGRVFNVAWNKLYRRSIWHDLRYREGHNHEDLDIILPVLERAKRVCLIDECLVMYRKRKGSITQINSFRNMCDCVTAKQHYLEYVIDHTPLYYSEDAKCSCLENHALFLLSIYFTCKYMKPSEQDECIYFLKEKINDISSKIDLKKSGMQVRASFFLYSNLPLWISTILYSVFKFTKKVTVLFRG